MAEQTPCQLLSAALGFSLLRKPVVLKLITYQLLLPVRFWPRDKAELSRLSFGCFMWSPSMVRHVMCNWPGLGCVVCLFQVRYRRTIIERQRHWNNGFVFPTVSFEPGTAGCDAPMLPLCYAIPHKDRVIENDIHWFSFWDRIVIEA